MWALHYASGPTMSALDSLPPDQRAVLQLVLKQGKTYGELAALLGIDAAAVRARASAALRTLGPEGAAISDDRLGELTDHLLGQQGAAEREATRELLAASAASRAWARVVASELRPLAPADRPLPEIPAEGAEAPREQPAPAPPRRAAGAAAGARSSSRLGGALLLAGLGILVAVLIVLLVRGGGDSGEGAKTTTQASTTATTATPTVAAQVNLRSPVAGSKAVGVAQILVQGSQRAVAVVAQGMQPSSSRSAYRVWLYNSQTDNQPLGFAPPVRKDGRLSGLATLPEGAGRFRELIVTRETSSDPPQPGTIVLRGKLQLGG